MLDTFPLLIKSDFPEVRRSRLDTLQVNLGYRCNQQCLHCHVNAGPNRTEMMELDTVDQVIAFLERSHVETLDLTGGAPEMNPHFRYLVQRARSIGVKVIDRCNLTILFADGQEDLASFLAEQNVEVVASLPCYSQDNVDAQRGRGVFDDSIKALQLLNELGYGHADTELTLNLVFNPQGPALPPEQSALESEYKRFLFKEFDITFNSLFTLTNMPIKRFGSMLMSAGKFDGYMRKLKDSYNPSALCGVMCKTLVSVDWRGYLYDCDFNQMLDISAEFDGRFHIADINARDIDNTPVKVADHCYACTASGGSSCRGATV